MFVLPFSFVYGRYSKSCVIVDVKLVAKRGFCNSTKPIFIAMLDVSKAYLQQIIASSHLCNYFSLRSLHIFRENTDFFKLNLFIPQVQGANKGSNP